MQCSKCQVRVRVSNFGFFITSPADVRVSADVEADLKDFNFGLQVRDAVFNLRFHAWHVNLL